MALNYELASRLTLQPLKENKATASSTGELFGFSTKPAKKDYSVVVVAGMV
jgi:hypothetical protein